MKGLNGKNTALKMAAGITVGVVAAGYIAGSLYYQSRFYPGTTVNGVNASGLEVSAVKEKIEDEAKTYELTLKEDMEKSEVITQKDVALAIDTGDGQIESFLDRQSGWSWPAALVSPRDHVGKNTVTYNKKKLHKTIQELDCVTDQDVIMTEDAKPVYEGGKFEAVEEVYGNEVDAGRLEDRVSEALLNLDESIDLEADKCYVQPKVTADSDEFKALIKQMNGILDRGVTYTVGSSTEQVDKDTIASWLTTEDSKTLSFNDEAMTAFLDDMGRKYNTFGQSKKLKTTMGAEVTVPGGSYGWRIDKEGEMAKLKEQLTAGESVDRDFVYQYTAHSHDGPDYGNSYVEVNLTAQHVWVYQNGNLVCDTSCVSGNPTRGNGTHTGAFQLTYKERDAVLRGDNYATPVSYWMPFNGNEGLHDATWRSSFGGNIYRSNGSHGCVNLPLYAAQKIFPVVDKGFPVLVYTMNGTESTATTEAETEEKQDDEQAQEKTPQEEAQAVIDKINVIGPVTAESGPAIKDARAAYNSLSNEAKGLVGNVQTLNDAEGAFSSVEAQAQDAQLQSQAQAVIDKINMIGPVTTESGPAIADAEASYNALPDAAKAKVGNAGELPSKRAEFNTLTGQ